MAQTHEERQQAKEKAESRNILEVADSLGMNLIREGRSYTWSEHDSLVITPHKNAFYWNSRQKGGSSIQLVQVVKDCSYKEAVAYLNQVELGKFEEVVLPPKTAFRYYVKEHSDLTPTKDYLINQRQLSEKTVDFFISQGLIAQGTYTDKTKDHSETAIIFKHKDVNGKIKGISFQGIAAYPDIHEKKGFLKRTYGDGFYGMSVRVGNPPGVGEVSADRPLNIIAFEAPIDMMSYYELHQEKLKDCVLLSMNGLRKGTISTYVANMLDLKLSDQKKVDYLDDFQKMAKGTTSMIAITLAVDNDTAGRHFVGEFDVDVVAVRAELPSSGSGIQKTDWNDVLKAQKPSSINEVKRTRLEIAKQKLARLEGEFDEKVEEVYRHQAQTNGQPMNDKRNGASFSRNQEKKEAAVFNTLSEIEGQRERVEKLSYQEEQKALGLNKQNGLIMSLENLPRIKEEIERSERGESMYSKATIRKYKKQIVELEAMRETLEKANSHMSDFAKECIENGEIKQWAKQPTVYFVSGLRKVAVELNEEGKFRPSEKYVAKKEDERLEVKKLVEKLNVVTQEKEEVLMTEVKTDELQSHYHRIVKNEVNEVKGISSFAGRIVTNELTEELKTLDSKLNSQGDYSKFEIEEVRYGEVMDNFWFDLGYGVEFNNQIYRVLESLPLPQHELEKVSIDSNQSIKKEVETSPTAETNHYHIVEFNETDSEKGLTSYQGNIVTAELLDEIKSLDNRLIHDGGYYKFYFDELLDGQVVSHHRLDVGDGVQANQEIYQMLEERLPKEKTIETIKEEPVKEVSDKAEAPKVTMEEVVEEPLKAMETQPEGTFTYLTKEEVDRLLTEHFTKIEQLIASSSTTVDLMTEATAEEKVMVQQGLGETLKAATIQSKNNLMDALNYRKNVALYNVKETTDNLRLWIKNKFNGRVLKINSALKTLVEKIEVKFAIEEKVVRPHPSEALNVKKPEADVVTPPLDNSKKEPTLPPEEPGMVALVRDYIQLTEKQNDLSFLISEAIQENPLADIKELQSQLALNQQHLDSLKERLGVDLGNQEASQDIITELSLLVEEKDRLTEERNQLVKSPDFLRSVSTQEGPSSLDQFKELDKKIVVIDEQIKRIEAEKVLPQSEKVEEKKGESQPKPAKKESEEAILLDKVNKKTHEQTETKETGSSNQAIREMIAAQNVQALSKELFEDMKNLSRSPESLKQFLEAAGQFHQYSPNNVQLITNQSPGATQVASQAKWEQLGVQLKPNAEPIHIYAPKFEEGVSASNQKPSEFYLKPVYDIKETTAEVMPPLTPDLTDARQFKQTFQALSESAQVSVSIEPLPSHKTSQFDSETSTLTIQEGLGADATLKTLVDEVVALSSTSKESNLLKRQFENEATSYMVASRLGLDTSEYTFDYLDQLKNQTNVVPGFQQSLTQVSKNASTILDKVGQKLKAKKTNKFEERVAKGREANQHASEQLSKQKRPSNQVDVTPTMRR